MVSKKQINDIQEKFFDVSIFISYFLIIFSLFGLSNSAPKFLQTIDYYIRIYICLFLIWRFNPLRRKYEFTDLDRKIAFSAGVFVLTTTALNTYIEKFKEFVKNSLQ